MVTDRLAELVRAALSRAAADGVVASELIGEIQFERPKRRQHGDWSTNIAMVAAKRGGSPRDVANALVQRIPVDDVVDRVEIAGPGFINFHLSSSWLHDVVRRAADPDEPFGRTDEGAGTTVNVEYVSANPTGPNNVVSGRHAAVGDAIANLLEATGFKVAREFYVNNSGRQIRLFAESVSARYAQAFGVEAEVPEEGYKGDYIVDVAKAIADDEGDALLRLPHEDRTAEVGRLALSRMVDEMRASLERFGTRFDLWFFEQEALRDSGEMQIAVQRLKDEGMVEEREGALWFKSSELGDDKDRVIVRADGEATYLATDAAYLLNKLQRGFDHLFYLWGPDHHGTVARLLASAEALGIDRARVEILIVQNVSLWRGGEAVKASKRAGVLVPLDELVGEVGSDAARYMFLTRSTDAPLEFDIELAKQQAPENPVYYVQYAHARICSILARAEEQGLPIEHGVPLSPLGHPSEDELMRKLSAFEEIVSDAAQRRAPQKVTRYVEELASTFSAFYRDCKVVSEDLQLSRARLALCLATKRVIADALSLLGVSAPQRM